MNSDAATPQDYASADVRRLSTLLEISRNLVDTLHLRDSLLEVLVILAQHPSVSRATLTLFDQQQETTKLNSDNEKGAEWAEEVFLAEKPIRDRVFESGRPVALPRLSQEPLFRPLGKRKKELRANDKSLVCVPVFVGNQTEAVLCAELHYRPDRDYDRALKFFKVVSTMISQAIKLNRLVEAERQLLLEENLHLRQELKERYDFSNIIGNSRGMQEVYQQVTQVARTNTTVLIRGESGTGKELIAHAIHYNSLRSRKPFIRVSCAALPETLIESERFGQEKGSFAGAHAQKKGRFEMAEGGTIFLDEIGELAPSLQVKLLRVLQEREFERVGGSETIGVNVRVITATNKDLEQAIQAGSFREAATVVRVRRLPK